MLGAWLPSVERGRPFVTLKLATSLDGRIAAADGSSRWITSEVVPAARARPARRGRRDRRRHRHRARRRPVADRPERRRLAARAPAAARRRRPPRLPAGARLRGPGGELVQVRTHDPARGPRGARRARGPARPRRGRPHARRRVPARRARRRGARLRRTRPARRRAARDGRPRHHHASATPCGSTTRSVIPLGPDVLVVAHRQTRRPRSRRRSTDVHRNRRGDRHRRAHRARAEGPTPACGVRGPLVVSDAHLGDSISVSGVCLTVTELPGDGTFVADVMPETLRRSALGDLGGRARSTSSARCAVGGRYGGHVVQGHVDGVGTILRRTPRTALGRRRDRPRAGARAVRRREGLDRRLGHLADGHARRRRLVRRLAHPHHARGDDPRHPRARRPGQPRGRRARQVHGTAARGGGGAAMTRPPGHDRGRARRPARGAARARRGLARPRERGRRHPRRAVRDARVDGLDDPALVGLPVRADAGVTRRRARPAAHGPAAARTRAAPPTPSRSTPRRASPPASRPRTAPARCRCSPTRRRAESDLIRPGHVLPLRAVPGRRAAPRRPHRGGRRPVPARRPRARRRDRRAGERRRHDDAPARGVRSSRRPRVWC